MSVVALSGLVAGTIHVLAGPDHLAAVAPLVVDSRRRRWRVGLLWGVGHTTGVLVVGALALALRGVLPIDAVSSLSERIVGVALIGVGLWGGRRALGIRLHAHAHSHDGTTHTHVHAHPVGTVSSRPHEIVAHEHTHASFAFGILHGFAGSAHVLGILPALALPSRAASITYLLAYGAGNITTMTAFSVAVGTVSSRARGGGLGVHRNLLAACSLAAIAVGIAWLVT